MSLVRRVVVLLIIVSCGVLVSQAPEFAQQYRQRLADAIDELTVIIQAFDEQANHAGLDRQAALNVYAMSQEGFLRQQGDAMRRSLARYQELSDQLDDLSAASPILRPLMIFRQGDRGIITNVWRNFVPALPASIAGTIWAGTGVLFGTVVAAVLSTLITLAARFNRQSRRRISSRLGGGALQ